MTDVGGLLDAHRESAGVVGASLGVLRDGSIEAFESGTADGARPVTPDTRFQIASITKPMVAAVLAMLAEERRLSFDDPVAKHVPELAAWPDDVTLRRLMAGTAGITLTEHREFVFRADGEDALALVAAGQAGEPRTDVRWTYSNTAWNLLGRAIETASGMEWESAMRAHLFEPLGLHATTFRTFDAATHAQHFLLINGERATADPWSNRALGPSGGSVWSTASDVARFASMLLDDRFAPLRDVHADVFVPHFADRWCLGLARFDWDGGPVWGWDGIGVGHRAVMRMVPSSSGALVLLTNTNTGRVMYRSLFEDLMPALFGVTVPPIPLDPGPPVDPARYAGTYAWRDRSMTVGDDLILTRESGTARLTPIDEHTFSIEGAPAEAPTLTFDLDENGRARALFFLVWAYPRV